MLMTTRSMHVAVFKFLFAGLTDISNFHVKCQFLTRQRVIAVYINIKATDLKDRYLNLPFVGLQIENLPDRNFSNTF